MYALLAAHVLEYHKWGVTSAGFTSPQILLVVPTRKDAEDLKKKLVDNPLSYLETNPKAPLSMDSGVYHLRTGKFIAVQDEEPLGSIFLDYPRELLPYIDELTPYARYNFNKAIRWPYLEVVKADENLFDLV